MVWDSSKSRWFPYPYQYPAGSEGQEVARLTHRFFFGGEARIVKHVLFFFTVTVSRIVGFLLRVVCHVWPDSL